MAAKEVELDQLTTEARNPASERLDTLSALELVELINEEDRRVPDAVADQKQHIARAVEIIVARLQAGGRLMYIGAGTSGRLGVLDAAECPPTFNTDPALVVGIIAGGEKALTRAVEGAEDHPELAERDLQARQLCAQDVVVGIATSGRTPYVLGGLRYARTVGAYAIGVSCNRGSLLEGDSDLMICPVVGPEILSGSTRMKAGTATKLVLNMLTTATMVRLGKTYGNLMVDLRATNTKLRDRSRRIVQQLTGQDAPAAQELLDAASGELKTAIVMGLVPCSVDVARQRLLTSGGHLRQALET